MRRFRMLIEMLRKRVTVHTAIALLLVVLVLLELTGPGARSLELPLLLVALFAVYAGARVLSARRVPGQVRSLRGRLISGAPYALAIGLAAASLLGSPGLALLALAAWLGVERDPSPETARSTVERLPVSEVMATHLQRLAPDDPLERAVDHARAGHQGDFPVTQDGVLVGLLTRNDLLVAFANLGRQAPVSDAMLRTFPSVPVNEHLGAALQLLVKSGTTSLPVVRGHTLAGLLSFEALGELLVPPKAAEPVKSIRNLGAGARI